jgi:hypothetical protein
MSDDQKLLTVPCMLRETIKKLYNMYCICNPTCMYCLVNEEQTSVKSNTVYIRKPDRPRFERSFLGQFLCPGFKRHLNPGQRIFLTSLDRFIVKKIFYSCQNGLG